VLPFRTHTNPSLPCGRHRNGSTDGARRIGGSGGEDKINLITPLKEDKIGLRSIFTYSWKEKDLRKKELLGAQNIDLQRKKRALRRAGWEKVNVIMGIVRVAHGSEGRAGSPIYPWEKELRKKKGRCCSGKR